MRSHGYQQARFRVDERGYLMLPVQANAFIMRFLIDTGAGMSAISSRSARELGLPVIESKGTTVGAGGVTASRSTVLDSLRIGPLTVYKRQLSVFELNDPLPDGVAYDPEAIEGLIGGDFLFAMHSIVDYHNRTLLFLPPATNAPAVFPPGEFLQTRGYRGVELATNAYGHLLVSISTHGTNLNLVLDSGVPHSVIDTSVARELALATEATHTRGTGVGGSLGKVLRTRLEQVILGPALLKGYPIFVADLNRGRRETAAAHALHISGVMGNDVLRLFSSVISYPDLRLYIKPPRRGRRENGR